MKGASFAVVELERCFLHGTAPPLPPANFQHHSLVQWWLSWHCWGEAERAVYAEVCLSQSLLVPLDLSTAGD